MIKPEQIRNRVQRMDSSMLIEWADLAASGMQRQLDDFRRGPDEAHLGEIQVALITMGAVVDELGERMRQRREAGTP